MYNGKKNESLERLELVISNSCSVIWEVGEAILGSQEGAFEDRLPAQMIIFTEWSPGAGASQVALVVKNLPTNAGDSRDVGSIPGSGRSLGGRHDNPLQYSHLEHPMDRGTWWTTVHWVAESQTQLKQLCTHTPGSRYFSSISHTSPILILPTTPKKSVLLYYHYG